MMRILLATVVVCLVSMPVAADAQGFGRDSRRGSSPRRGDASSQPRSSSGFSIQIGPGGMQFGAGGSSTPHSHSHGNNIHDHGSHNHNHHSHNHHQHGLHHHQHGGHWHGNVWIGPGQSPVLVSPALPSPPAEPILLVNPAGTQAPVQYRVNQYSYVLPPGSTQQLGGDRTWTIDYDRGSNFGRQTYVLTPGRTYRFGPGPRGWELFVATPQSPPILGQ